MNREVLERAPLTAPIDKRGLASRLHEHSRRALSANPDAKSIIQLDRALDEAKTNRWIVVSMKSDWKRIFGFEK